MSRTHKDNQKRQGGSSRRQYRLSARAVRRDSPDLRKLARAVIQLAMAEAEADAAAEDQARRTSSAASSTDDTDDEQDTESDRA